MWKKLNNNENSFQRKKTEKKKLKQKGIIVYINSYNCIKFILTKNTYKKNSFFIVLLLLKNLILQCPMPILPQPTALNPSKDAAKVEAIDYSPDFENSFARFDSFNKFYNSGKTKNDLVRCIPGLVKPAHLRQLEGIIMKKAYEEDTYKGYSVAEFNIKLTNNQCMNFHNVHLVFPMKIKKSSNNNDDLDTTLITINNSFAHWIKEIDIKRYSDDIPILPLTNTVEI